MTGEISTRENVVRCPKCFRQQSRTAYTPLHHLKLPIWTFSYLLVESLLLYPAVLSGRGIQRKLGVSNNTALLLKRRMQLFMTDLLPVIKAMMAEEIRDNFNKDFSFPEEADRDLTEIVKGKPVVNMDSVALFSATQRANGGRKRHKHTGQTASIYLSDKVAEEKGKYQIGTLCHTIGLKRGAVILDSVPDQKQETLHSLLDFLPKHCPTFTDDGYPWLKRFNFNHRAICHSARAKDKKRNVWAKDRWSKNGVNNQVAEGFQRILKHSFISGYSYFSPEYSQLYLNEYAGIKAVRVYSLDKIISYKQTCFDSKESIHKTAIQSNCVEYKKELVVHTICIVFFTFHQMIKNDYRLI